MRGSRLRYDKERCYYHLMNRVAGEPGVYPFGDAEKEKLFQLAVDLSRFYSIELLSFVAMGNHWHAICETGDGLSMTAICETGDGLSMTLEAQLTWGE